MSVQGFDRGDENKRRQTVVQTLFMRAFEARLDNDPDYATVCETFARRYCTDEEYLRYRGILVVCLIWFVDATPFEFLMMLHKHKSARELAFA